MPLRTIKASEVREYVFCSRSWAYRQRGIATSPEAMAEREERLEQGNRAHREHGEAVRRVSWQLENGTRLAWAGMVVVILVVMWRSFFS